MLASSATVCCQNVSGSAEEEMQLSRDNYCSGLCLELVHASVLCRKSATDIVDKLTSTQLRSRHTVVDHIKNPSCIFLLAGCTKSMETFVAFSRLTPKLLFFRVVAVCWPWLPCSTLEFCIANCAAHAPSCWSLMMTTTTTKKCWHSYPLCWILYRRPYGRGDRIL